MLDTDLVNTIMNDDDDITKSEDNLDDIGGKLFLYFLTDRFNFIQCLNVMEYVTFMHQ